MPVRNRRQTRAYLDGVEEEIVNLFTASQGLSTRELAARYSCSKGAILDRLRRHLSDTEIRSISRDRLGIDDGELVVLFTSGDHTASSLARQHGCDIGTVCKRLRRSLGAREYLKWIEHYHKRSRLAGAGRSSGSPPCGPPHKLLPIPGEELCRLFSTGKHSIHDLAAKFECSRPTIRRRLLARFTPEEIWELGRRVHSTKMSGDRHFAHVALPDDEVVRRFRAGESSVDLARAYQCSQGRVKKTLRQHLSPEEIRERMRAAQSRKNKGRVVPEWYRLVLRKRTGIKHQMFGKRWTPEQRARKKATAIKGAAHHNWKGGITPESLTFIASPEWKDVARQARLRDGFRCRVCGRARVATVHHLVPRGLDPAKRAWLCVENLVTVCKACHRRIEPVGWKSVPTRAALLRHYQSFGLTLNADAVSDVLAHLPDDRDRATCSRGAGVPQHSGSGVAE